jgi:hypothetical protein
MASISPTMQRAPAVAGGRARPERPLRRARFGVMPVLQFHLLFNMTTALPWRRVPFAQTSGVITHEE